MPEQDIDFLENQIPALSGAAVNMAYANTLASGGSVLEAKGGAIYEIFSNGNQRLVKQIEPPVPVQQGQKILLS
ncbi:MAG: hypothetical protein WCH57_10915 [Verrucomicrobiota bacterium]